MNFFKDKSIINILLTMSIDINNIIILVVCIIISIIIIIFINRDKFSLNCKTKEVKIEYYDKQLDDNIKLIIDTNKKLDNDLL
jgi:hypothetical protein